MILCLRLSYGMASQSKQRYVRSADVYRSFYERAFNRHQTKHIPEIPLPRASHSVYEASNPPSHFSLQQLEAQRALSEEGRNGIIGSAQVTVCVYLKEPRAAGPPEFDSIYRSVKYLG